MIPMVPPSDPGLGGVVFAEASTNLNGAIRFQSADDRFISIRERYLDQFDTLRDWSQIPSFDEDVRAAGLEYNYVNGSQAGVDRLMGLATTPFQTDSPFLVDNELFPFQHVGLNLATEDDEGLLIQWSPGTGKTLLGSLVAQRYKDTDRVDLIVIVCKRSKLIDWRDYISDATRLSVSVIDGSRKKRHQRYEEFTDDVMIINYEKARSPSRRWRVGEDGTHSRKPDWSSTDLQQLMDLFKGKRVLFLLDEAQHLGNPDSLQHKGWNKLINKSCAWSKAVALTATPYQTSPLNIRNMFNVICPGLPGVSVTKEVFRKEYGRSQDYWGRITWNHDKLPILGKRIEPRCHVVTKSDPLIAAQFPDMTERRISVELTAADMSFYQAAVEIAWEQFLESGPMANRANFQVLRMICACPESVRYSESLLAAAVLNRTKVPPLSKYPKYQGFAGLVETITEAGEKLVAFSFYANSVLAPYQTQIREDFPDLPLFLFRGGMKAEDQAQAVKDFNEIEGPALIFMSDAGAEGINLYSPSLVHIETPTLHATYIQRRDRISRIDSIARGISSVASYRFLVHDTIEEKVEDRMTLRRDEAELIAGRQESSFSEENLSLGLTDDELFRIMFEGREAMAA